MKIYLYLSDPDITECLQSMEEVKEVLHVVDDGDLENMGKGDVIILSDRLVDTRLLIHIRSKWSESHMLYLISNREDAAQLKQSRLICHRYNIDYVLPYRTVEQIRQSIRERYFQKEAEETKVIGFFSSMPRQGLTEWLLSVGQTMAARSNRNVGLLGLNGFSPGTDCLSEYNGRYFDEIFGMLNTGQFGIKELEQALYKVSNRFYYLAGNRDLKKMYYYEKESVEQLIRVARDRFDILLLDLGAYLDHAMPGQGMIESDLLCLLTTQQRASRKAWERTERYILDPIFEIDKKQLLLMVGRVQDHPEMDSPGQVSDILGIPLLAEIPNQSHRAVDDSLPLEEADERYKEQVEKTAKAFCEMYGLPYEGPDRAGSENGWLSKWFKKAN